MSLKRNDWTTKLLLAGIAGLLAANLLVISGGTAVRTARAAGIPDSGAQLEALIDEMKGVNQRLDTMQKLLDSGKLVVVAKTEKEK